MRDYNEWKKWRSSKFGLPTKDDIARFEVELARANIDIINNDLKILEIGFGNGGFLGYLKFINRTADCIEIDSNLNELAQSIGFFPLPSPDIALLEDHKYDLIVAFDVIEHIDRSELISYFRNLSRILKVGGVFIGRVPNGDSPFSMRNQNGDITHQLPLGSEAIKYLGISAGLSLHYLGGSAQPILNTNIMYSLQRLISFPFKLFVDMVVKLIFLPRGKIFFTPVNLTFVLKKFE